MSDLASNHTTNRMVLLHLHSSDDEAAWRAALASQRVSSVALAAGKLSAALRDDAHGAGAGVLLADVSRIAAEGHEPKTIARWLASHRPEIKLALRLPRRAAVFACEEAWAKRQGMCMLIDGHLPGTPGPFVTKNLDRVLAEMERPRANPKEVTQYFDVLRLETSTPGRPSRTSDLLPRLGMTADAVITLGKALRGPGGVRMEDRSYRLKRYRSCFVASEAVEWLVGNRGLVREHAVLAGEAMQALGIIHHVVREQTFRDEELFFRFGAGALTARIDLSDLARQLHGPRGVERRDRLYLGKTYERCFDGAEAVTWMQERLGVSTGEAESLGQSLIDLGVIHHVVDEHDFVDANYFYRFRADERV